MRGEVGDKVDGVYLEAASSNLMFWLRALRYAEGFRGDSAGGGDDTRSLEAFMSLCPHNNTTP